MIVILDKHNLNSQNKDKDFIDWKLTDFFIDMKTFQMAEIVFFIQDAKIKIVKNRYEYEEYEFPSNIIHSIDDLPAIIKSAIPKTLGKNSIERTPNGTKNRT